MKESTIAELEYKISKLEERIETLENKTQRSRGVVLEGTKKAYRQYIEGKKQEIERKRGDDS